MKNIPNRLFIPETEPLFVGGHNNREWPLGQLAETPDGRLFRYALNGAVATIAHKLYQADVVDDNFDTLAVQTTTAVGDTTLAITNGATTVVEDLFAFGTACCETSVGCTYPIKSNTADGAGNATITLTLQKGVTIQTVMTAGTETINIAQSPYHTIEIHPSVPTSMPVGVPLVIIGISQYGWIQTHGLVNILVDSDDAWTAGWCVRPSDDDNGGVQGTDYDAGSGAADTGTVGKCLFAGVDTHFAPIFLTLE